MAAENGDRYANLREWTRDGNTAFDAKVRELLDERDSLASLAARAPRGRVEELEGIYMGADDPAGPGDTTGVEVDGRTEIDRVRATNAELLARLNEATERIANQKEIIRSMAGGIVTTEDGEPVRRVFETGARRSTEADGFRFDLISPVGLRRLAARHKLGETKGYPDYNWEKGMPVLDLLNHAIKHVNDFLAGDTADPDNLAGAAWGLFAAMHSQELWPHLNRGTLRGPGCTPPSGGGS